MDTSQIESGPRRILKNEWFWVAIIALAVVAAVVHDVRVWQGLSPETVSEQVRAVDQKKIWWSWREGYQFQRSPHQALGRLAIRLLNVALLLGGSFLLAALAVLRTQRRLLNPALARPPVWGLWDVLKVGALYALGIAVFGWVFHPNPVAPLVDSRGWYCQIFARILLIGAIVNVVIGERFGRWGDLGLRGRFFFNLLAGVTAFVALQPVMFLMDAAMFDLFQEVPLQPALQTMLESPSGYVLTLACIAAVLVVPLSEELLFRVYLQPALERWFGGALSVLLTAALFAAGHRDLYAIAPTFVLGLTLGYLYNRTRSLTAPLCLHIMFNGLAVLRILTARP